MTNKGLADRISSNMNIAQSEIHKSYYRYTVTIDLDQIGIDKPTSEESYDRKQRKIEKNSKLLDYHGFII